MSLWQTEPKKIYIWVDEQIVPITTPWIYHNSTLWLISLSSDWNNWLTIADKNLWATSTDITSTASYWNMYQWGNNYGWLYGTSVTKLTTQVDASVYWPWNYYSDSNFRYNNTWWNNGSWDSSWNKNLWWGVTDTYAARQWPCASWFHIPSTTDMTNLQTIWVAIGALWSNYDWWKTYLFMPQQWSILTTNATWSSSSSYVSFWTSDAVEGSNWYAHLFMALASEIRNTQGNVEYSANGIRPFKNEPVQPTVAWTVLYQ